jgi:tRNA modification GTPase
MNTTIAAISSGQSPAAIGIVRISGPDALGIIDKCLHRPIVKPRMMYNRSLYQENGEILDDVMLCYFKAPHSYTGEDIVEIYAHGGPVNLAGILEALCHHGAKLAEPGEFSRRAFLNGKIDLAKAEAIMDIIHAQNELQCREAQRQLSGTVSQTVTELRNELMSLLCAIEATIDFSQEQELAPIPTERLKTTTAKVLDQLLRMKRAHEQYRSGGLRTVLAGRPNAGKSSLFNRLLGHDRAIVTDIAGTTTDTLESTVTIQRHTFSLIDTAGIVETDNPIERIGVQRARDQIAECDILVILIDGSDPDLSVFREIAHNMPDVFGRLAEGHRLVLVHTKSDISDRPNLTPQILSELEAAHVNPVEISTISRQGLSNLEDALVRIADDITRQFENVTLITSQRHIALIEQAMIALQRSQQALEADLPAECIAADIHDAAQALDTITGAFASEDIINEIFSHFCVGK